MTQTIFDYTPIPVHAPFHQSTAFERVMFGGYGSGKSYALCAEAIAVMLEAPGVEVVIIRKTVPSLRDTTEAIFVGMLPDDFLKRCVTKRAGGHYESIQFPNGSKVMFRSIPTVADWLKLKSLSVAWLFYDEVDEIDREAYEGMLSRVRQTNPTKMAKAQGAGPITRRGIVCAANPAGRNWCWERWVNKAGENYAPGSEWFRSSSLQNPHLPIEYIETLLAMPEPWVRRYVLCSFDDFGGAIYPDWTFDTHVVQPPKYAPMATFLMGFDPGTHAGNAALWCYYDRDKHRLVGVAEYLETGLAATRHAAAWRRIEAEHRMRNVRRIADPKAVPMRDRGSNMTLRDQYRRLGFHFQLGTNDVNTRYTSLGQLITQGRFVVTENCPRTYEQIKNYRWEDLTPTQIEKGREAKPLKKDVDLVDAAQYIACRYVAPPKDAASIERSDAEQMQYEIHQAIKKQLRAKSLRSATGGHDLGNIPL